MQWYYLDDQRQQVETDDEGIRRLVDSGELAPDALVWNDSLTGWLPVRQAIAEAAAAAGREDGAGLEINTYQSPVSTSRGGGNIRALASILARQAGWTRFLGIVSLVTGACALPIGAFAIWMGIVLLQIAARAEEAQRSGSERAFAEMLDGAALYFKAHAVVLLAALAFAALVAAAAAALALFAALQHRAG